MNALDHLVIIIVENLEMNKKVVGSNILSLKLMSIIVYMIIIEISDSYVRCLLL